MSTKDEAIAAHRRGDLIEAERLYRDALHATPSDAELHHCMGLLCYQAGRAPECLQWLKSAIALAPRAIQSLQLLIRACNETGDAKNALLALDQYLALRPDDAGMLNIKGQQLTRLGRLRDAEHVFQQAAERTGKAPLFHDLGLCRQWLGDLPGAIAAYEEAIRRGHNHPRTKLWLAQCLRAAGRIGKYYQVITEAARTAETDIEILIEAQAARRYVCDWRGFEASQPDLLAGLQRILERDSGESIPPGILNFMDVEETTISRIARRYAKQLSAAAETLQHKLTGGDFNKTPRSRLLSEKDAGTDTATEGPATSPTVAGATFVRADGKKGEKIRLGYLSTDFFAHAVGFLVRDLFESHDRARFEIYGYSLRHRSDEVQARIQQGCDVYRNLAGRSAEEIVRAIVDDRIDILIDLAGYTSAAQPVVLAARPAPVQISWLGYLGTSGSNFIDYLIADEVTLPPEIAGNYTEKIIRLPHFMPASPLPVAEQRPTREDAGLGGSGFVFCSFNQPYKLDHVSFGTWMKILHGVPGSRLWMYVPDLELCGENLHREATRLKMDPDRLVFSRNEPMAKHMARTSLADLALDPFHISGGATSVAALFAGVPILTMRGHSFLARMGSSINARLGMEELDCSSPEQYVAKAIELATNPAMMSAVRSKLAMARHANRFFDTSAFVRSMEEALQIAWERHEAGLAPADIRAS
jgi:predicted O-linked N-acetylglucosamine transferase (SPINDLY family)